MSQVARPAVVAFTAVMETKLKENDHKVDWRTQDTDLLVYLLLVEVDELRAAIEGHESSASVIREAADVANFAMMIADNFGPRIGR